MESNVVVVTGGASGIGKATVMRLARAGCEVVIGDRDAPGAQAVVAEAKADGLRVRYIKLDLSEASSVADFAKDLLQSAPALYGLVNAAGWDKVEPFMDNTPELSELLIRINLLGPISLTRALLPRMIEARSGKIINISSDAGRVGSMGEVVYSAAKGGIIAFTKALAREMARYQINVNCVCPGPTDTPLLQSQTSEWALRIREGMVRAIPFRRLGTPDEIAEAIEFFLSKSSSFATGQVLSVSGGLTMAD
jgi:2-hydroxycyclohexanecarboxyl-CoA dehydrogenase